MSLIGKIQALFSDKEQTQAVFPMTKIKAVSNDDGVGLDAILEDFATQNYVATEIAKAQLDGGDVDLSGFATKDELSALTYEDVGAAPASHAIDKNNPHGVTAAQVGALPTSGGTLTGAVSVSGNSNTVTMGTGSDDVYIRNATANKYLQLKNDGTLAYSNNAIYHAGNKPTPAAIGAAASSHGNHVPTTQTASNKVFLRNDNTWQTVTPANIGAVPTSRTVNSKALSGNISLTASDVGAVPTSRTVNGKALSSNISLTADNVGAASIKRLWANASTTSQFNAQIINVSVSGYDAILITARTHINTGVYTGTNTSVIVPVGTDGLLFDCGETGSYLVSRKFWFNSSKVEFLDAKYPSTYAASSLTTGNKNLIPTAIFGINW